MKNKEVFTTKVENVPFWMLAINGSNGHINALKFALETFENNSKDVANRIIVDEIKKAEDSRQRLLDNTYLAGFEYMSHS